MTCASVDTRRLVDWYAESRAAAGCALPDRLRRPPTAGGSQRHRSGDDGGRRQPHAPDGESWPGRPPPRTTAGLAHRYRETRPSPADVLTAVVDGGVVFGSLAAEPLAVGARRGHDRPRRHPLGGPRRVSRSPPSTVGTAGPAVCADPDLAGAAGRGRDAGPTSRCSPTTPPRSRCTGRWVGRAPRGTATRPHPADASSGSVTADALRFAHAPGHLERQLDPLPRRTASPTGWSGPTSTCWPCRRPSAPTPSSRRAVRRPRLRGRPRRAQPVERGRDRLPRRASTTSRSASTGQPGLERADARDRTPAAEARALGATCGGVRVWSLYVPNGRTLEDPHYTLQAGLACRPA